MPLNTVQDIEQAIRTLDAQELAELCSSLDQYQHPFDARIQRDFAAGRLEQAIAGALDEEQSGRVHPL